MTKTKIIEIEVLECKRCGYEWTPRKTGKPKACPGCNSRIWEREKEKNFELENVRKEESCNI